MPGHVDNQPRDGVACTTSGNYGSTVFDPMNGEFLEFNLCDPCLVAAGEKGRVWIARTERPVAVNGILIGHEDARYLPLPWHKDFPTEDATVNLWEDEIDKLPPTVRLNLPVETIKQMIADESDD
jgi:hypothetical protein